MGPPENPTRPTGNQGRARRKPTRAPRTRRCLLKGCERRFRPKHARERYCSTDCRRAARAWSCWKAQEVYRATPAGKVRRNGQSRRYRERVKRHPQPAPEAAVPAARVITESFFRSRLRPAWLLRRIRVSEPITASAILFARVPARLGTRLAAGTPLAPGGATSFVVCSGAQPEIILTY
jgi:hypothetical protein